MANELNPFFESADRITGQATAAISGKRFLKISGDKTSSLVPSGSTQIGASDPTEGGNYRMAQCVAGEASIGVSTWDAAIGEKVGAVREGILPVACGADLTAGQLVQSDANGMAIPAAAGRVLGMAMTACDITVAGDKDAEILFLGTNVVT